MKRGLIIVCALALFLRLYHLASLPVGFHIDEVKVGWNAWSILKTGKDDWLHQFALYYNTFGDYRPTGIFYITIPSLFVFGLNIFAVRFPSALLGALSVIPVYLLAQKIVADKKYASQVATLSALVLAISPWHIQTSRATSEVVIAMFFALWGLYFFVLGIGQRKLKHYVFAFLFFAISYLFYHSIRLLAPFIVLTTLVYFWKSIKVKKFAILFFLAVTCLTVVFALNPQARGRFDQVSVFKDLDVKHELSRMPFEEGNNKVFIARMFHNKPLAYTRRFINEYANYFSASFLIDDLGRPDRYSTTSIGVLTYSDTILLVTGLIALAKNHKKFSLLPLLLVLISPLPAALTTEDAPNIHRSLFMVFNIAILEAIGLVYLHHTFSKKLLKAGQWALFLNFIFFLHMYSVHAQYKIQRARNFAADQLALELSYLQKDYEQIIVTDVPDNPYPWIAFFGNKDPKTFNLAAVNRAQGTWSVENFTFTGQRCPSRDAFNNQTKKILVVDAEGCDQESNLKTNPKVIIVKQFKHTDEAAGVVYTLWATR